MPVINLKIGGKDEFTRGRAGERRQEVEAYNREILRLRAEHQEKLQAAQSQGATIASEIPEADLNVQGESFMAGIIPDLTPTIIDWDTGEVLFQGLEGSEVEKYRAEARENMKKLRRIHREEAAAARLARKNTEEPCADNKEPTEAFLATKTFLLKCASSDAYDPPIEQVLALLAGLPALPHDNFLVMERLGAQTRGVSESYLQTHPQDEPVYEGDFVIEYRDGVTGRHYRNIIASNAVAEVFVSYLNEDDRWRELIVWRDITHWFEELRAKAQRRSGRVLLSQRRMKKKRRRTG